MDNKKLLLTWLEKIQGIGPVVGKKIYKYLKKEKKLTNETTEEELRDLLRNTVEINLPVEAKFDLKYNPTKRVEREKIKYFDDLLKSDKLFIGGSYCRGRNFSGDIDILYNGTVEELTELIKEKGIIMTEIINDGTFRRATYFQYGKGKNKEYIHVDIFLATDETWIFTKLYVIGSGKFNLLMRQQAKKKNMLLNQEFIAKKKDDGTIKKIKCKKEKDIFKLVGMDYSHWAEYSARDI